MISSVNPSIRLPHRAFELLRDLVQERTGLYFDDAESDIFLGKLSPLVVEWGFDSLLDYYYFLKYDPGSAHEWRKLFEALTVQESFFWREMDQIRALVDVIVPRYFRDHSHDALNILSSMCCWRGTAHNRDSARRGGLVRPNLTSEADIALAAMASPVIFCRNVLIYFSESAARKTVRIFAERMPRPGYLFVGAAESLSKLTSDFKLREIGGAFVYGRS